VSAPPAPASIPGDSPLFALGLGIAPALVIAASRVTPRLAVSDAVAGLFVFAGGAAAAVIALVVAARAALAPRSAIALAAAGAAIAAIARLAPLSPVIAAAIVDLGLVAVAHAAGGSVGRRVAHPGHLLPACAVAAAADVASLLHPSGPSHAIEKSERALSVLAIAFPVPGTSEAAPALGAGDLVFLALVFGAARAHRISMPRAFVAAALGLAAAGALAARFATAIPALVPIGAAVVLVIPEARRVRPADRRTTAFAVAIAIAIVLGVLASPR
jgi:hypothetical protein